VYIDAVHVRKTAASRMACGCVHFTPGARTAWHSHAVGQTLYITEGIALLGTRDGDVIVARPGPVIYTQPGEEHWHGAAPAGFMAYLALYEGTGDGDGATWLETADHGPRRALALRVSPGGDSDIGRRYSSRATRPVMPSSRRAAGTRPARR
jgi:quercetin dioxygenase-like cupin family protein